MICGQVSRNHRNQGQQFKLCVSNGPPHPILLRMYLFFCLPLEPSCKGNTKTHKHTHTHTHITTHNPAHLPTSAPASRSLALPLWPCRSISSSATRLATSTGPSKASVKPWEFHMSSPTRRRRARARARASRKAQRGGGGGWGAGSAPESIESRGSRPHEGWKRRIVLGIDEITMTCRSHASATTYSWWFGS